MSRRHRPVPPAPRALLIDAMGTLVELEAPAPRLREALLARFGIRISQPEADVALRAEIRHYRAHMGAGRDAAGLAALRRDCARVLREALPGPAGAADLPLEPLVEVLLDSLHFRAHADARPALEDARRAGARVVVVSNWDVSLGDVLERLGLAPLLWAVVTSAGVGVAKPSPAIFAHALALAGVEASQARHVGDSRAEDVEGARACGIEPVLLMRTAGQLAGPELAGVTTIAGLHELRWDLP